MFRIYLPIPQDAGRSWQPDRGSLAFGEIHRLPAGALTRGRVDAAGGASEATMGRTVPRPRGRPRPVDDTRPRRWSSPANDRRECAPASAGTPDFRETVSRPASRTVRPDGSHIRAEYTTHSWFRLKLGRRFASFWLAGSPWSRSPKRAGEATGYRGC